MNARNLYNMQLFKFILIFALLALASCQKEVIRPNNVMTTEQISNIGQPESLSRVAKDIHSGDDDDSGDDDGSITDPNVDEDQNRKKKGKQ